jgi:hypothetical protein
MANRRKSDPILAEVLSGDLAICAITGAGILPNRACR